MPGSSEMESYHILVIEDNPGDYYLIREYIEEQYKAAKLTHATTCSEAEKVLNGGDHNFDAILLDLTLPDLSGEELIEKITGLEGSAVTIALTGYSDMEFSIKSLAMGVSDYLLKDELSPNGLWKSIRYSMERKAVLESLKESEERYRDLFQNNPNPLLVWENTTGRILDVNREAVETYGYNTGEFCDRTIASVFKEDADPKNLQENEIRLHQKKNGDTFFAEISNHRIDFNGTDAFLSIVNDVSDKLELQERMVESAVSAEEEERNRIAKELHDGIVQQLVACGMFIQNLQDKTGVENKKLHSEFERLHTLMRDIANETRDISHNLKSAEFDITSLADLTEQFTRQLTRDSEIAFVFKNHLSYEDRFDPDFKKHLYRILQELCSNVIKHSGGKKAVISMEVISERLFFTVKDDGTGMKQPEGPYKGIGIRNVKSRVYRLNGVIEFQNNGNGNGLTVHIELPLRYKSDD